MSSIAVGWALRVRTGSSTRKAILLALADRYNDDTGLCCPSLKRIAHDVEASRSCVSSHLKALEEKAIIRRVARQRENGSRTSNQYELCMGGVLSLDGGSPQTAPPEPELEPEDQDLSTASRSRRPNVVWDALVAVTGFTPTTTSEKSDFAKTVRELRAVIPQDASDANILSAMQGRRRAWERAYGDARFTHRVLRGKWAELGALANGSGSRAGGGLPELKDGETF